jgi:hypothetical protein
MPRALFAGIFFQVGWGSIEGNPIMEKTLYLLKDKGMISPDHPLYFIKKNKILLFVAIQWFVFAVALGVSQVVGECYSRVVDRVFTNAHSCHRLVSLIC